MLKDGACGCGIHELRSERFPHDCAVFGPADLSTLPESLGGFAGSDGTALRDFHIPERIASPATRRAHTQGHAGTERPIDLEALL